MTATTSLAPLLERFFADRLMRQRQVSRHTIRAYRDSFRLFLAFARERLHTPPSHLTFETIDAPLVVAFLDHLERHRHLSVRSRNLRLTALHSFFRYAAFELPSHAAQIQRVLAIPSKRGTRTLVPFLTRPEVDALVAAPDRRTWFGRRDAAFLLVAVQTGLRLSEMTSLTRADVTLDPGAHLHVIGKGRKERCTPLAKPTTAVLRAWLREPPRGDGRVLFPTARGTPLSADAVAYLMAKHVKVAAVACPSLTDKHVTAHVLRHYLSCLTMSGDVGQQPATVGRCWKTCGSATASPDIVFRSLQAVEESQELIAGAVPGRAALGRARSGERLFLHRQRRLQIDLRGLH